MAATRIDYAKFADECLRLAQKQAHPRDTQVLLQMGKAWLLVAELAQLHREEGSSDGHKKPS